MISIIFTLCSNNYLAHARVLANSVHLYNPGLHFVIGLVDENDPAIDYTSFKDVEILKYDSIGVPFFDEMLKAYNIIEFNTSVKPFYIEYLLKKSGSGSKVIYLDPDILVYASLDDLFQLLDQHSVILTPNLTQTPPEVSRGELASLRHGMFNLGFIGVRNSEQGMLFIQWWQKRLRYHCIINKPQGIFVDQKWVDLAPIFFKDIHIIYHQGYNMAWWNFDERKVLCENGKYYVNGINQELKFFHFSGYYPGSDSYTGRVIGSRDYLIQDRPDLVSLFNEYNSFLKSNGYENISVLKPRLTFKIDKPGIKARLKKQIKKGIKKFLPI